MTGGNVRPRSDEFYMERAIQLATRGISNVFPNPRVGAVLVANGEIVGEGFHRGYTEPHAEIAAIAAAGERARGGTLYLNLEPCCHHGNTPPCTEAIIAAGIRKVVFGIIDPDERVSGRGAQILRDNGIEVVVGVKAREAFRLNYPFIFRKKTGRSLIVLKIAVTLDGSMTLPGEGWFTSEESRKYVHYLRAYHEAVAVGIGTVLSDDPALDRRYFDRDLEPPVRMVFDSDLRFPPGSRWLSAGKKVIIYCGKGAGKEVAARLREAGAGVNPIPEKQGRLDLGAWRDDISDRGITSVLVEGGAGISTSLLRRGLVDRLYIFTAPRISGVRGGSWFREEEEPECIREGRMKLTEVTGSGQDILAVYDSPVVRSHFASSGKE